MGSPVRFRHKQTGSSPNTRTASTRRRTAGGFAAAAAIVAAVEKAKSTDTEKLIAAMEGMEFDT